MPKVSDIAVFLDKKAPCALKMDFDNVGLLCGFPENEVKSVLVALDITQAVIEEAVTLGADLIVSHHPVIFNPLRNIINDNPEGRRIIGLIQNNISAVCMHTNLDIVRGGVNTALMESFGGIWEADLDEVGLICHLGSSAPMNGFLLLLKERLHCSDIRYNDAGRMVKRIALCGGAGGDILREAAKLGCDTVLTGEIKHHQWIDGREWGMNLIESGHFCTENPVIPVVADWLREEYPELKVTVSAEHCSLTKGFGF